MIRVFIVADQPLARAALHDVLSARDVEVVGSAPHLESAVDHVADGGADVLLVESPADGSDTLTDVDIISDIPPEVAIVMLSDHPGPAWSTDAFRAGIRGLLSTAASPEQLVAALHAAAAGLVVMQPALGAAIAPAPMAGSRPLTELVEPLTRREREVLQMLAGGLGNKTIAARLAISEHTVKFHVASIFGKLGAVSRTEAVSLGIRRGLVLL